MEIVSTEDGGNESVATDGLMLEARNAAGLVTLDRPRALNALSAGMIERIGGALRTWARDPEIYAVAVVSAVPRCFSAGGDVRELLATARSSLAAARAALAAEYRFNWQHECFSKPTVSLIDGMVMGSGVGLTSYGTHRVAGPAYRFSMPEVRIGFFPDVGTCWLLSRMPESLGMYLALTGEGVGPADAFHLGLVTHVLPEARVAEVVAHVADADPVDPILDAWHADPGEGPLLGAAPVIARCFSAPTVGEIRQRLASVSGAGQEVASRALARMGQASPLALEITHRAVTLAQGLDLRQTLEQDYRIASRLIVEPDFLEGVRARLVDKDGEPRWRHGADGDGARADVDAFFAPVAEGELALPSRAAMQTR
ncbi:MAG: enoyl-CoA hydratase/isomerase family protein [Hyphomicrobiaceae bacterium]